jgi:hypothetical protein
MLFLTLFLFVPSAIFAAEDAERQLVLTTPQQVTLGVFPQRLDIGCEPAAIQTGLDCGMPEMCGLDPCLCGIPDAYGACACNGTRETTPTIHVSFDTPGVVALARVGKAFWLVPLRLGDVELSVEGTLVHHNSDAATISVHVEAPLAPLLLYFGFLFAAPAAVLIVMACRRFSRRGVSPPPPTSPPLPLASPPPPSSSLPPSTPSPPLLLLLLPVALLLLSATLLGCAPKAQVTQDSPWVISTSVVSTGDGTEDAQRVEARLVFSAPLVQSGALIDDLKITLNDAALDEKAIFADVTLEGDDTLLVTLKPAEGTGGPTSTHFFAVYEGKLSVSAREATGGLAHLVARISAAGADTRTGAAASAVIEQACVFQIPSGLVLETLESIPGSSAANTPAQASLRVVASPCIRAVAWVVMEPDGARALVHNHEFFSYGNDVAGRTRYAAYLIEPLARAFGSSYTFTQDGDTITVTAVGVTDGQEISPGVYEGVIK